MLLNDLLKLFSTTFDINEERFTTILESNNIKLNQRLLCNIIDKKNNITNDKIESVSENNLKTNIKKTNETGSGRGRGRPKKTKEMSEDANVVIEVELITLNGKEFYKTNENVLMNMGMEIEGILKDGKVVKSEVC